MRFGHLLSNLLIYLSNLTHSIWSAQRTANPLFSAEIPRIWIPLWYENHIIKYTTEIEEASDSITMYNCLTPDFFFQNT